MSIKNRFSIYTHNEQVFFDKVLKHIIIQKKSNCWIWQGCVDKKGYGIFGDWKAYRWTYFLWYGDIPDGKWILHKCDNTSCVNPNHLFAGTRQDNIRDMVRKGRQCSGIKNAMHKLDNKQVREIRRLFWEEGKKYTELSRIFKVTAPNIRNIIRRKTWKHLK